MGGDTCSTCNGAFPYNVRRNTTRTMVEQLYRGRWQLSEFSCSRIHVPSIGSRSSPLIRMLLTANLEEKNERA